MQDTVSYIYLPTLLSVMTLTLDYDKLLELLNGIAGIAIGLRLNNSR